MIAVTPTDRPNSVRNRGIIEDFGVVLSIGFLIFCLYTGFCHRTESDLLLFLFPYMEEIFQLYQVKICNMNPS